MLFHVGTGMVQFQFGMFRALQVLFNDKIQINYFRCFNAPAGQGEQILHYSSRLFTRFLNS